MTSEEFNATVTNRVEYLLKILVRKGGEYSRGSDRLHNFKRTAAITNQTPAQVCVGFMMKHVVSILDLVDDLVAGADIHADVWQEKITDAVAYMLLLEAIVKEGQL